MPTCLALEANPNLLGQVQIVHFLVQFMKVTFKAIWFKVLLKTYCSLTFYKLPTPVSEQFSFSDCIFNIQLLGNH